jgi:hypothetical protein
MAKLSAASPKIEKALRREIVSVFSVISNRPLFSADFLAKFHTAHARAIVRNAVHIRTHGSGGTFEPEDIQAMSLAFEEVCKVFEIQFGAAREREVVAVRIIELCRRGERSAVRLTERVLKEAGVADHDDRRSA